MKNLKIGLLIAFCIVQNNYAQTKSESEIIISEDNLVALISKIKQKRDSLYHISQLKTVAVQNLKNSIYKVPNTLEASTNNDYDLVMSRMNFLDSKLDYLTLLMQKQNTSQTSTVQKYVPTTQPVNKTKPVNTYVKPQNNNNNSYLISKIESLERELNDVKRSQNDFSRLVLQDTPINTVTPLTNAKTNLISPSPTTNNYYTQSNEETGQKSIRDTLVIEKRIVSNYDALVKEYSNRSQNILFDNNSANVNESFFAPLDQLVVLCNNNTKIDLYLKGFASKKGNVKYNEKLSLQRTESVKKYLIDKGIHPTRILSQYHGVDYASKNEENARRVTISYIVRR